jgi:PAS domain S-box-containing protein
MASISLRRFKQWVATRSLRNQILTLVLGATIGVGAVVAVFSYQRSVHQTIDESQEWAKAIAHLMARSSVTPINRDDIAQLGVEANAVAAMPGVKAIRVVNKGGLQALKVERQINGTNQTFYERESATAPSETFTTLGEDTIRVHVPIFGTDEAPLAGTAPSEQTGWVTLDFSYAPRLAHTRSTWLTGSAITLGFVLLALVLIYRYLTVIVKPLRKLVEHAGAMNKEPGTVLQTEWRSQEVRDLGRALNWLSGEMARQIDDAQRRLQRQRVILDTAADAIIGVSPEGLIYSVNPAAERMFGRPESEIVGKPLSSYLEGMTPDALSDMITNGMLIYSTQSRIGRMELNAVRHGGSSFPIEVLLGEVSNDPDLRYTCIVRDLSDTKTADEYLTLYSRVLDCTLNGIAISDARRYPQPIVHVNPAYSKITGYAAGDVLGRNASFLDGPLTDKQEVARLEKAIQAGTECNVTLKNYRKDGSMFYNKLAVSPVRDTDGAITHYITVVEDVTAQIEVKQRLIERTKRLNTTFELSPDGFAVFGYDDDLISSNPALRAMIGEFPATFSLKQFDGYLRGLCDDSEDYRPILDGRQDQGKITLLLARPTRRVIEREIRQNTDSSRETFVYFRDMTQQHEVDRMKSEFLATAAHELRTPLASILGFTELMLHRKFSDEQRSDMLQTVHRQGSLLLSLLQELLDLSRIESRQGKDFKILPTPLSTVVEDAVQTFASRHLDRPVRVEAIPDCLVMADATKIEQALINLLSNAFKYSPDGGEVSVSFEQRQREGEDMVAIAVKDQGMGMTPAQLERAFERFYRADASGKIPGTGLGLNLVKEIVEIHGGAMKLSSVFGEGTVATMWLKALPAVEIELVD